MQENVLGSFKVIRGFADLSDLAFVSNPLPYAPKGFGFGEDYQREIEENHVREIEHFLGKGRYRFFPEIVLGLWSKGEQDEVVSYKKRSTSANDSRYRVRVKLKALKMEASGLIHRIDGNHRLEAASRFAKSQKEGASIKSFQKAPFCFVILDSEHSEDDLLAEAMLFNLINSKALPLTSEHSLSVMMQDELLTWEEDKQVHLTRRLRDSIKDWPEGFLATLGETALSRLHATACTLTKPNGPFAGDSPPSKEAIKALCDPLSELAARLKREHEHFVRSPAFLPIAAEVYCNFTSDAKGPGDGSKNAKIGRAERWLLEFARWFDSLGLKDLAIPADPLVLWTLFKRDFDRKARTVFVAMSFTSSREMDSVWKGITEGIQRFNNKHPKAILCPIRVDLQGGASYQIPAKIFEDIRGSGLVIADLTDEKPNVYLEVGFAMSLNIPFILTFHEKEGKSEAPWEKKDKKGNRVHFDLTPFRQIRYADAIHLRDELTKELDAFFNQ